MKFSISVKQGEEFITVGNIRPNKSGKSWQLTIFADKTSLMPRSPCGKYINALVTEDKRPDFNGNTAPKADQQVAWTSGQPAQPGTSLNSDTPF